MKQVRLSQMNVTQLIEVRDEVLRLIEEKTTSHRRELERQLAAIDAISIGGGAARSSRQAHSLKGVKVAPKYRNPANPKETWTGRGKQPRWLAAATAKGKKVEDFLIKKK